jgi:hypothetical protein
MRALGPYALGLICSKMVVAALLIVLTLCPLCLVKGVSEAPQMEWSRTYVGYEVHAVIQTADRGYAIAGQNATYSTEGRGYGNYAPLLIRTDSSGEARWEKVYGRELGPRFWAADSVVQTVDLGYALSGGDGGWLLKLDAEGRVQWNKTFEQFARCRAIQASDGGYVLAGITYTNNMNRYDSVLVKTDESGNPLWSKMFSGGLSDVRAAALVETDGKGYAIAGNWGADFWFAKTDSDGHLQWNQTYRYYEGLPIATHTFVSVAKTKDGGFILAGGDDIRTAWLVKTDSQGYEQWNQHYPNGNFLSVAQTGDEGYVVAGRYGRSWLVRTDSLGNVQWNMTGDALGGAASVIVTNDGGYAVAGSHLTTPGTSDETVWLAKFAPESAVPESPNSMVWIIATTVVIVAAVGVGLVVYLRKHKRQR